MSTLTPLWLRLGVEERPCHCTGNLFPLKAKDVASHRVVLEIP